MRQTLAAIIALSLLGVGCATLQQETRMYRGPFGRTEVGAVVIAADPSSSKILVETYDGDLWIYDVDSGAAGLLSGLRVGDEVSLAFDDRIAGKRAIALNVVAPGTRTLPPGILTLAELLPAGVVFGAPATAPSSAGGTAVAANGAPVFAPGLVVVGPNGMVMGNGIVITPSGTVVGTNGVPLLSGTGVIVPGFGSFSQLPAGVLSAQAATGLGLGTAATTSGNFTPGTTTPGVTTANPNGSGKPVVQGPFTPGTIAPGVTTANPNGSGKPVVQGPFTPGTVAPGVSQPSGNAPPATTSGARGTTGTTGAPRGAATSTTTPH
jgi:hypothetical protein